MARVGIGTPETFDVDLWDGEGGGIYLCQPATKKVSVAGKPIIDAFNEAVDAGDEDKAVELMGEALDLRLEAADKKRPKASELVKQKWDDNKVTVAQLIALFEDLEEASRPT
jgi:hypothetical protein